MGEVIALAIAGRSEEEAALRQYLKRELPNFMQPRTILVLETLPRNANGKLDRTAIKAMVKT